MLNTLCRIWHGVFFGLLNSAQHYVKTPQWLLDREGKVGESCRVEKKEAEIEAEQQDEDWNGFKDR